MVSSENKMRGNWPWWRVTLVGLCVLGLALSAYLGWHHVMGGKVIGCGGGNGCDQVLSSRWSAVGGVLPVSGLAAGTYLAMLVAIFFANPQLPAADRRLAWRAMLVLASAAAGSAIWFTIVQKWVIKAFCPYCMTTHVIGVVTAALVFWQAPRQMGEEAASGSPHPAALPPDRAASIPSGVGVPHRSISARSPGVVVPLMMGLGLAAILALCQYSLKPAPAYQAGESVVTSGPAVEPRAVPLIGSPEAPYIVTLLFDYRCRHCQKVHSLLEEVIRAYDGKVAFVLCPAPLNTACNPYVARDVDEFKDSCELARIAAAVWIARRESYAEFDRWLFSGDGDQTWRARSAEAANAKAVELIGREGFAAARADPWIDRFIQSSIRIYGETINNQSGNAVPKLLFGQRWVIPEVENAEDLLKILQETLRVPKP